MKLLFDQNISFRIIKLIENIFPNPKQVRNLNLEDASDLDIWEYSKTNNFTIVTFDADFSDIANIKGNPPKIIWLRTGNTTTTNISKILMKYHSIIEEFIQNPENNKIACLEISN